MGSGIWNNRSSTITYSWNTVPVRTAHNQRKTSHISHWHKATVRAFYFKKCTETFFHVQAETLSSRDYFLFMFVRKLKSARGRHPVCLRTVFSFRLLNADIYNFYLRILNPIYTTGCKTSSVVGVAPFPRR